jgi:adiponectin receptor
MPIGLIAASFGTVVYNAFYCRPKLVYLYLGTNAACGALGSYLPFQRWFNMRRMKVSHTFSGVRAR